MVFMKRDEQVRPRSGAAAAALFFAQLSLGDLTHERRQSCTERVSCQSSLLFTPYLPSPLIRALLLFLLRCIYFGADQSTAPRPPPSSSPPRSALKVLVVRVEDGEPELAFEIRVAHVQRANSGAFELVRVELGFPCWPPKACTRRLVADAMEQVILSITDLDRQS